jgi:hypothetical protein
MTRAIPNSALPQPAPSMTSDNISSIPGPVRSVGENPEVWELSANFQMTYTSVSLLWTLFRQSTGSSAFEGLWGTSDPWPDRLRGNCSGEGRWQGALYPSTTAQVRDSPTLPAGPIQNRSQTGCSSRVVPIYVYPQHCDSLPRGACGPFRPKVGGLLGGVRHEWSRMDRFKGRRKSLTLRLFSCFGKSLIALAV